MSHSVPGGVDLWVEEGGKGGPTLVLLHGLGANADVWQGLKPMVRDRWPGRWLIPDLRGHGRSGHRAPYSYAGHAADIAGLIGQHEEAVVVGHSMGGVVAMALATGWFGVRVRRVVAFGIKIRWTDDEVAKLHQLARAPVRWFDSRAEAVDRYLKVSGLIGLIGPDSPAALSGIKEEGGRFRLASDPAINAAAGPAVADFVAAMHVPLHLAAGAKDPMVTLDDMRAFRADAEVLEGVGHNLQVERPELVWRMIERGQ
jgi:pimeloyl-ACP methyl ester carboxylesterase